jgi:hypothetical protein
VETADALIAELAIEAAPEPAPLDLSRKLSDHFILGEMIASQTAARRGIANIPGPAEIAALERVCEFVLEPVRRHYRRPVKVSSGYRAPALNAAIGGSPTSQHPKGEATDFEVPGVPNYDVACWIEKNVLYDQLILECYTPGIANSGWIHVGRGAGPRFKSEELTAVRRGGRMIYLRGLQQ